MDAEILIGIFSVFIASLRLKYSSSAVTGCLRFAFRGYLSLHG